MSDKTKTICTRVKIREYLDLMNEALNQNMNLSDYMLVRLRYPIAEKEAEIKTLGIDLEKAQKEAKANAKPKIQEVVKEVKVEDKKAIEALKKTISSKDAELKKMKASMDQVSAQNAHLKSETARLTADCTNYKKRLDAANAYHKKNTVFGKEF